MKNKLLKVLVILLTICALKTNHTLFMKFEINPDEPAITDCEKSCKTIINNLTIFILDYFKITPYDTSTFLKALEAPFKNVEKLEDDENCKSPLKFKIIKLRNHYIWYNDNPERGYQKDKVLAKLHFKRLLTEDLFTITVPLKFVDLYLIDQNGEETSADQLTISNWKETNCELTYLSEYTNGYIDKVSGNTFSFKYNDQFISPENTMNINFSNKWIDNLTDGFNERFIIFLKSLYYGKENTPKDISNPFHKPIIVSTVVDDNNVFSELIKKATPEKVKANPNQYNIKFTKLIMEMSTNGPRKIHLEATNEGRRII